jgi:hypothetical protein
LKKIKNEVAKNTLVDIQLKHEYKRTDAPKIKADYAAVLYGISRSANGLQLS